MIRKILHNIILNKRRSKYLKNKVLQLTKKIKELENKNTQQFRKIIPDSKLRSIEVHLCEHCNLNCKGCNHFSPLAKEEFTDINIFEKDLKRLSELTNSDIERIKLLGGEPLLNPEIIEFFKITRKYFPNSRVEMITNGILLNNCDEEFYKALKEYNIVTCCTKYPIKLNHTKLMEIYDELDLKLSFWLGGGGEESAPHIKKMWHYPLDLEGRQNIRANFYNCFEGNYCIFLRNGKLYPCPFPPNIHHFNNYFDKNIPLDENDGIDIHKANSLYDILDFLSKPIPFCKYCKVNERNYNIDWEVSQKDINEWI